MTHARCPECRLRFEAVVYGDDRCSDCGGELEPALASQLVGYRLARRAGLGELACAIAASVARPDPVEDA
jgi:uncharacterized protein (DUF983 family)